VTGAFDWLSTSPEAFLERYAPAAASRRGNLEPPVRGTPLHRTPGPAPAPQAIQAIARIPATTTYNPVDKTLNTKGTDQMNRMELEAMMKSNPNELMTWNGRTRTIGEHLRAIFKGEGAVVEAAQPAQTGQPIQPSHQAGPGGPALRISQAAADALPQAQYEELEKTGHIQGLTRSDNGRAVVHVRNSSGVVESRFSFDPETGKVGPGRGIDMRMFHAPAAGTK
jgi:hypothetical protein